MIFFDKAQATLNAICPYFTMFPLEFSLGILARQAQMNDLILDPFCGRGTTNLAARLLGLDSVGVDSSPVAAAITAAKFVNTSPEHIVEDAKAILGGNTQTPRPTGEFWGWAYHDDVLGALCQLRAAFLVDCSSPARIALRGIVLGALHGPRQKTLQSYFSNQCPRTYAPKPAYAVEFWRARDLRPVPVDFLDIIKRRATRYYSRRLSGFGQARLADSRIAEALKPPSGSRRFTWAVTSPPYYGMRTYIADQWLRHWFLGGPDTVDYRSRDQLVHNSIVDFTNDLRKVWRNTAAACSETARFVVRFGGIADRSANPRDIVQSSFQDSEWRISTITPAGDASDGRRQADTFLQKKSVPIDECVVWAQPVAIT